MKHSLDHSTATEANGIIWELCSRCEAWVSQHERGVIEDCDGPVDTPSTPRFIVDTPLVLASLDDHSKRLIAAIKAVDAKYELLHAGYARRLRQLEQIPSKAGWSFAAVVLWITACTIVLLLRGS